MFLFDPTFYYPSILLQAFCVWHCIRRGNAQNWIWLIVFLPVVGALVYLFSEVIGRREVHQVQGSLGSLLQPGGAIGRLEKELRFSDTFANRLRLADAYAAAGRHDEAIGLYESCLSGPFHDNEQVFLHLIPSYFETGRYDELLPLARKVYALPEFQRSRLHVLYARALEKCGQEAAAEAEFVQMQGRYSFFEARYFYGLFLLRSGRTDEGQALLAQLVAEGRELTGFERRQARPWTAKAKERLERVSA